MSERIPGEAGASPSNNWLVRAYYTPVSDALRGQLSARYDVRGEIAAAGLPAPVGQLIGQVVRRTRLWKSERIDVARELVAHFADGLAAGRTAEQLTADFGDIEQAAQLIRNAKIRSRALPWQAWRVGSRLLLVMLAVGIVGYSAMALRFYLGRTNLAHNYWNEVNAARQVPEAERAWPLYRTAAIKLSKLSKFSMQRDMSDWTKEGPAGEHWNELVAAVERHRESLDLIRQAAGKPHLGCLFGDPADRQAVRDARPDFTMMSDSAPVASDNPEFISMLLDYVQVLRELARLTQADLRVAAEAGEGDRALADVTAMIAMAGQIFQPHSTLIEQLVGVAIFSQALDAAVRVLREQPALWSEAQLRDLAHTIAAYRGGRLTFDLSMEQRGLEDMLQRLYTDDGDGDGRMTPDGLILLNNMRDSKEWFEESLVAASRSDRNAAMALYVLGPGLAAMVGSRRENRELYDSLLAEAAQAHQGPPWLWDRRAVEAPSQRLADLGRHPTARYRYLPTIILAPYLVGVYDVVERQTQLRDAAEVAIALVLWQRRHGAWPSSLAELVPDLLPAVPVDRLDGQPLRYALVDGQPVVYSIGVDRDDDGGRAVVAGEAGLPPIEFGRPAPKKQDQVPARDDDGDWILWPPAE